MAIDYGDARTGVAVSDISRTLTGDAWVVSSKRSDETARVIVDEAMARDVGCIVVGYPKNMDGTIGSRAEKSEQFAETLRSLVAQLTDGQASGERAASELSVSNIEVVLWDERLTTKSASHILTESGKFAKKRKKTIDAIAASLLLESYINSSLCH